MDPAKRGLLKIRLVQSFFLLLSRTKLCSLPAHIHIDLTKLIGEVFPPDYFAGYKFNLQQVRYNICLSTIDQLFYRS